MLVVTTWCWGKKYGDHYITRLFRGVMSNLEEPARYLLITDRPRIGLVGVEEVAIKAEDAALLKVDGCFARLRLFDPQWLEELGIAAGTRVVCLDLDSIVTGKLDALFCRPEPFMILTGANAANPCPYNGSVWMLRAGYRPDVWAELSLSAAAHIPFYEFPDDQGWLHYKIPDVVGWKVGAPSGVYAFRKPGWPKGDKLPADARLVVFPGKRDPAQFGHIPWVRERWAA